MGHHRHVQEQKPPHNFLQHYFHLQGHYFSEQLLEKMEVLWVAMTGFNLTLEDLRYVVLTQVLYAFAVRVEKLNTRSSCIFIIIVLHAEIVELCSLQWCHWVFLDADNDVFLLLLQMRLQL